MTQHQLYETADSDAPKIICDPNGEVALALCRVCGGAEASLPSSCPGRRLTDEESDAIQRGVSDVIDGVYTPLEKS